MTILSYGCLRLQIGCKIVNVVYGRSELVLIQIVSEVHVAFLYIDIKDAGQLVYTFCTQCQTSQLSSTESMGTFIICAFAYLQAGN